MRKRRRRLNLFDRNLITCIWSTDNLGADLMQYGYPFYLGVWRCLGPKRLVDDLSFILFSSLSDSITKGVAHLCAWYTEYGQWEKTKGSRYGQSKRHFAVGITFSVPQSAPFSAIFFHRSITYRSDWGRAVWNKKPHGVLFDRRVRELKTEAWLLVFIRGRISIFSLSPLASHFFDRWIIFDQGARMTLPDEAMRWEVASYLHMRRSGSPRKNGNCPYEWLIAANCDAKYGAQFRSYSHRHRCLAFIPFSSHTSTIKVQVHTPLIQA